MIAGIIFLLALVPALVGLGVGEASGLVAVGLGGLAAVVGGVKLVAVAWGLVVRPARVPPAVATASID